MFLHRKELIQPVKVGKPDARFGTFLLEQFGGATGELTAALQYWVQSFHVENAGIRDMLQDIAMEEFSHLEMVGKLIAQHTSKVDQTAVYDAPSVQAERRRPPFSRQPRQLLDCRLHQRGWQRGPRPARQYRGGGRRPPDLRGAYQGCATTRAPRRRSRIC